MAAASSCTGVTIAVRGKSVGKHDRRDAQRTQDQLRKNTNAALGNIRKRDLFPGAGFQTKILALDASRLESLPCQGASEQIWAANFRFGSKADIPQSPSNVRFTPKRGHSLNVSRCPLCDLMLACLLRFVGNAGQDVRYG